MRATSAILSALALGACAGGPDDPDLDGTAARVYELLKTELVDHQEGYADASARLFEALTGGEADGVSLQPLGAMQTGTLEADLDGDGTRETTLQISVFDESTGEDPVGPMTVSAMRGGPGEPTYSLGGRVRVDGGANLVVDEASGSYESDEWSLYAQGGGGTVPPKPTPGETLGTMDFTAFDAEYTDLINGRFEVEAVEEEGQFRVKVVIHDDPETPADESQEFYVE